MDILKNRINENKISHNTCVVHLRVGDILDLDYFAATFNKIQDKYYNNNPNDNDEWNFDEPNYYYYLYSKSYYVDKIEKLKKLGINKIIIIAGSHVDCGNYKYSTFYINKIKRLFENNGFTVELRLGSHPDSDIMLVYNSNYFIGSKGGYSKILEEIVLENDNTVL